MSRVGPSIGWGLLVGIVGPLLAVLVFSSVVGIPLAVVMLGAVAILSPLGYVTSAFALGRRLVISDTTGGRIGAFFAGFGILRGAALIPGLGFLVWLGASIYGIGALAIAAWGAGRGAAGPTEPKPEPEEPEPKPAAKAAKAS